MPMSESLGPSPIGNGRNSLTPGDPSFSAGQTQLIQLCVVVEKDERGYGLTVSGDKPVHVQSVKDNGASARAGVQQGDRIYKVNGSSVANFDHTEVVALIKYQVLNDRLVRSRARTFMDPIHVSKSVKGTWSRRKKHKRRGSLPVEGYMDSELTGVKSEADLTSLLPTSPSSSSTAVKGNRLSRLFSGSSVSLTLLRKPENTRPSPKSPIPQVVEGNDRITAPLPSNAQQEQQVLKEKVGTIRRMLEEAQINEAKLQQEYNKSRTHKASDKLADAKRVVVSLKQELDLLISQSEQMESVMHTKVSTRSSVCLGELSEDGDFDRKAMLSAARKRKLMMRKTMSVPATVDAVDHCSPLKSPSLLEGTMLSSPNSEDTDDEPMLFSRQTTSDSSSSHLTKVSSVGGGSEIISMEDDDFPPDSQDVVKDHGPFNDLEMLKRRHAHCSVFLSYLLSNGDPSSLLFNLITDVYQQGSLKDMKRWAYEIHSTFLVSHAPLAIKMDEIIVHRVEATLTDKVKSDKEECMKAAFHEPRLFSSQEVNEYLADFRMKRDMGLGTLFGDTELTDNLDKNTELAIIDKTVRTHYDKYVADETPRSQAMCYALATVMKDWGVSKGGLDRQPSFAMKDINKTTLKNVLSQKLKKSKDTVMKHPFQLHMYQTTTLCDVCKAIMWGVGYQGYQCKECDMNVHRECLNQVQPCKKVKIKQKSSNEKKRISLIPNKMTKSTSTSSTRFHISLPHSIGHSSSQGTLLAGFGKSYDPMPRRSFSFGSASMLPGESVTDEDAAAPNVEALARKFEGNNLSTSQEVDTKKEDSRKSSTADTIQPSTVSRSGSFKLFATGKSKETRRHKSDVDKDGDVLKAIDQSQSSSSASSLSNKSDSSSTERVNDAVKMPASLDEYDSDLEVETSMPSLEGVIPKDQLRKMKPKEKKRQEVINELFYTEKSHVRNLKLLDKLFYKPMSRADFCSTDLVQLVFPDIHRLIGIHVELNNKMKKKLKENPVVSVKDVAELLLSRFDGEAGEEMKRVCSNFCQNHTYALNVLKDKRKQLTKLHDLFHAAETNPLCRRLQFKDLIIAEVHRLTKYPLLIDTLTKYTSSSSEENSKLLSAAKSSRAILNQVNQAVKECENHHKLVALQKRLDRKPIQNSDNPLVVGYKEMDLTRYKLVCDGALTWKFGGKKQIDLHVVLLEEILVLLQIQDDGKLVLKCQSQVVQASNEKDRFTHSPIITLNTLLLRQVATDKKAFFIINTSQLGPQIYEVVASTQEEKKRWFKYISEAAESQRSSTKARRPPVNVNVNVSNLTLAETTEDPGTTNGIIVENESKPERVEEENVSTKVAVESSGNKSTAELLKEKDEIIHQALIDKKKLLAQEFDIPDEEFDTVAEVAGEMEGERDARSLILASLSEAMRLTLCISPSNQARAAAPAASTSGVVDKGAFSPQEISSIAANLSKRLNCLLDVMEERETETERLRFQLQSAERLLREAPKEHGSRPGSFISNSSSSTSVIADYPHEASTDTAHTTMNPSALDLSHSSCDSDSDDEGTVYADTKEEAVETPVNKSVETLCESELTEGLITDNLDPESLAPAVDAGITATMNSAIDIDSNGAHSSPFASSDYTDTQSRHSLNDSCNEEQETNHVTDLDDDMDRESPLDIQAQANTLEHAADQHVSGAMFEAMAELRYSNALSPDPDGLSSARSIVDCDNIQVDLVSETDELEETQKEEIGTNNAKGIDESDESDALSAGSLD